MKGMCYFEMDMPELSANQNGVFFNRQYFSTGLISNFDFLNAGRHR